MNGLAGGDDESSVTGLEGLRITEANEGEDEDEDEGDARDFGDKDKAITEGTNNIHERRVITSPGSSTEIDEFGNLIERLVGLDDGCFCGKLDT